MSDAVVEKQKQRLVDDTGKAVSPFERWPGYVKFPEVMTLPHYRLWSASNDTKPEDGSLQRIMRLEAGAESKKVAKWAPLSYYELAFHIVEKHDIKNADLTGDAPPYRLVEWIAECMGEWLDTQLTFRFHSDSDVA